MAITVKHNKVSTIPDDADTSLVRPSDWNADHTLTGTVPVDNGGTGASTLTGYVKGNGTAAMTATTTVPSTDITGLGTMSTQNSNNISVTGGSMSGVTISDYVATATKGVANGVASLDGSGTVPISQLPAAVLGALSYQGTWNASTNTPTLTSSVGTKGYYYVVNVAGSTNLNGVTDWQIGDWAVYNGTAWQKVDNTDAVTSVNGYTGTVVLTAADVSAVPYTGATGAVDLNAKSLVNVSNLGIGTTTVPTISMRAVGNNNSTSRIAMRGYSSDANSSAIRVTKFRGTTGAPQAPLSGDSLGKFELAGYGTTSSEGYPQSSLEGVATENWGATARGTKALVKVTPNTTTTQVTALTIDQNSAATFASSVTATSFSGSGSSLTGVVTSVTGTSPVVSSGGTTPAISMPAATTSVSGYLTSTDWTTFNNKSNTSGTVTSVAATVPSFLSVSGSPITSSGTLALTYSGTALPILNGGTGQTTASAAFNALSPLTTAGDTLYGGTSGAGTRLAIGTAGQVLTVNAGATAPQWSTPTTGTVTSVSGTTGRITSTGGNTPVIDLASGVATAGTTGSASLIPVVTIDTYGRVTGITTAANPQGTVTSVTGTAPVVSSGGATPAISMAAANTTTNGYLTSTDWNTFNGKGSGTVTSVGGTGTVNGITLTGTVTTSGNLTLGGTLANVSLATQVTGNLPVTNLNSGTSASATTFWRGDGAWATPSSSGISWQTVKTSAFSAAVGEGYPVNTTSASITATLPASPSAGNSVTFVDYAGTWGTNTLIVNPNGNKLNGSVINAVFGTNREGFTLVYVDATQGWIPYVGFNTSTPTQTLTIDLLAVAGGAGGGAESTFGGGGWYAGGGGAGGYLEQTARIVTFSSYTVTVGAGGAGGASVAANGVAGNNSVFGSSTALGGGFGAGSPGTVCASGGSGGSGGGAAGGQVGSGSGGSATQANSGGATGYGFGGGNSNTSSQSGGGGGAGGAGSNTVSSGGGGAGRASSISGSSVTYASGGNVGGGVIGAANKGIGGAGGVGNGTLGSAGGSGVVILKFPSGVTATYSAGVTRTTSTSGGFKIDIITATSTTSETVTFS